MGNLGPFGCFPSDGKPQAANGRPVVNKHKKDIKDRQYVLIILNLYPVRRTIPSVFTTFAK